MSKNKPEPVLPPIVIGTENARRLSALAKFQHGALSSRSSFPGTGD
jgi:hypothetical protein